MTRVAWTLAATRLWVVSSMTRDQLIETNKPLLSCLSPDEKRIAWDEMRKAGG